MSWSLALSGSSRMKNNDCGSWQVVRSRMDWVKQAWPSVRLSMELEVPVSKERLWEFVSDLRSFLTTDPYHRRVLAMRRPIGVGTHLAIEHGLLGFSFFRFGRLLRWQEGSGYSISDLSARGCRQGFPHVFNISIEPDAGFPRDRSKLRIEVKGRWTAGMVPTVLRRWWLKFTCRWHLRLLRRKLEAMYT